MGLLSRFRRERCGARSRECVVRAMASHGLVHYAYGLVEILTPGRSIGCLNGLCNGVGTLFLLQASLNLAEQSVKLRLSRMLTHRVLQELGCGVETLVIQQTLCLGDRLRNLLFAAGVGNLAF